MRWCCGRGDLLFVHTLGKQQVPRSAKQRLVDASCDAAERGMTVTIWDACVAILTLQNALPHHAITTSRASSSRTFARHANTNAVPITMSEIASAAHKPSAPR